MHICVSSIRLILADSDAVGTLGWIHAASKARAAAAVGEPIAGADRQGRVTTLQPEAAMMGTWLLHRHQPWTSCAG